MMMLQVNQQAPIVIISAIVIAAVVGIDSVPDRTLFNAANTSAGKDVLQGKTLSTTTEKSHPQTNTSRDKQSYGQNVFEIDKLFLSTRAYRKTDSLQPKAMPCCTCASCSGEEGSHRSTWSSSKTAFHRNGARRMYTELVEKLLEGINPMVPPVSGTYTPVNIRIEMVIDSVLQLDIRSQTFTTAVWFQVEWQDDAFSWDTANYPVDLVVLNERRVWRPVMAIGNTVLPRDQIMKARLPVNVNSRGEFRWYPGGALQLDCQVDLRLYPFDTQMCFVRMIQWGQLENIVNCTEAAIRSEVGGNGEWSIVGLTAERFVSNDDYVYWWVDFRVTLKRRWDFYALNVLFPIVLVSGLNCVVFVLPVQGGEKMSVSVTIFLTLAVFMTLIQDGLPSNSDTVCYLAVYLATQVALGALAVFLTALEVTLHNKPGLRAENRSGNAVTVDEDQEAMSKKSSRPPATMGSFCFIVFVVLNVVSLLVYCLLIVAQ